MLQSVNKGKKFIMIALNLCFCLLFTGIPQQFYAQKDSSANDIEHLVLIQTEYGNIKIKLYNETPKHRDNFLKLAKSGFFDGTLFHRVIRGFMIQGGDPESKNADADVSLGNGDVGYTIPAEFNPKLFHKRGALAAARLGDDVNPEKESSGCQFYIVQGKKFTRDNLMVMQQQIKRNQQKAAYAHFLQDTANKAYANRIRECQKNGDQEGLKQAYDEIKPLVEAGLAGVIPFKFNEAQIEAYTTVGGAPHLDGSYTVFGEVVEGMEVVDTICNLQVNPQLGNRPLKDVKMTIKVLQ